MQNRWLSFLIIGFLAIVTLLFYFLASRPVDLTQNNKPAQQALTLTEPSVTFVNPTKGAKNPRVTIVEFSDFECTHCQTIQNALEDVLRAYPEDVRLVWKDMPNPSVHPQSIPASIAAHCADRQGKFWEYHDAVFARQTFLSDEQYKQIAQELELNMNRFTSCTTNQDTAAIVQKDAEEGRALDIIATPTLFIGKEKIVGEIESEELIKLIQGELFQL
jgi:protein-disulfide isomerase